jgi:hypothetical protein
MDVLPGRFQRTCHSMASTWLFAVCWFTVGCHK